MVNRPKSLYKAAPRQLQKQFSCRVPDSLESRIVEINRRLAQHGEKLNWSAAILELLGKTCDEYEEFCDQLEKESEQPK